MTRRLLRNCVLLDPEAGEPAPGALLLEDGRIAARFSPDQPTPEDAERIDLGGQALAPGLIDLHFHGAAIFHDAAGSAAALAHDASALVRHGTTAFLTTTVALPAADLAERLGALAGALDEPAPGAMALGIHLEGPWISPAAAGAQPAAGIRPCRTAELDALLARAEGHVRMVTLAPEVEGAAELLERLGREGVLPALGHSRASAEQVDDAVARGARHVTHLFNAMGPLHHREPGLAGAALADDRLHCDLICDGVHVDARMLRVAARAKGERLILISDAIDPADTPGGFGAGALVDDGVAWRLGDGRLAGSRVDLALSLRNAQRLAGMTRLEALAACTLRPARLLGIEAERGTLRPGARADLAVLGPDDELRETWIGGERVYQAAS